MAEEQEPPLPRVHSEDRQGSGERFPLSPRFKIQRSDGSSPGSTGSENPTPTYKFSLHGLTGWDWNDIGQRLPDFLSVNRNVQEWLDERKFHYLVELVSPFDSGTSWITFYDAQEAMLFKLTWL